MNNILTLILLLILVACVGFFSSSETAYLALSKLKVRRMQEEGRKHANTVAKLKSNMEDLLTVVLVGTNFLNSLASALATALAIEIFGSKGAAIAPIAASFFMATFGQIIPKTAAVRNPEKLSLFSSLPLLWLERIFYPIVWIFSKLSHVAVVLVEKIIKPTGTIVTEEELKTLIDVGSNEGTIEKDESYLLNKIIKFNDLQINDVMKHRSVVSMINQNATYQEVKKEFQRSGFSTLTVYSGSRENVVGVLNYKKLMFGTEETNLGPGYAARHMAEVLYIPGTLTVFEVLQKFRYDEHKFAVVLDEQGQTDGIITME
ncbi:MAG: CNNM domain-containing protein, partial [Treponema sp.]|nr:CNNM domain-containing protein [Treponema sp.]